MTDSTEPLLHWCEVCGKEELLSTEAASQTGTDFPPKMGVWGVISPRSCGTCPMDRTVWWAVQMDGYDAKQLSADQKAVVARINAEVSDADPDRPDHLDLDDGGSWVIETRSGSRYLLQLDGDESTVIRLAVDNGRTRADGRTVMRRDGDVLPLVGLVEPPIQVGRPAYLVVGAVTDQPGYVSTTRATTPVVEIRRVD